MRLRFCPNSHSKWQKQGPNPSLSEPMVFVYSVMLYLLFNDELIKRRFIEYLLCARHCYKCLKYSSGKNTAQVFAFKYFIF